MGITWAKTGSSAMAEMEKHEKEVAAKAEQNKKMWRFWIPEGEEARITFVDGNLTPDGKIDFFMFYEHNLLLNGSWGNFYVCTKDEEPCPICETTDRPAFVGAFTIIDHREYKSKKGEIYKDTKKLFVAKMDTIKTLQILAGKRGGLAGCTFDVVRTGEKSPSVGSMFDFVEKSPIEDLQGKFMFKPEKGEATTYFTPADYAKEIVYLNADELRAAIPALASASPTGKVTAAQKASLDKEL